MVCVYTCVQGNWLWTRSAVHIKFCLYELQEYMDNMRKLLLDCYYNKVTLFLAYVHTRNWYTQTHTYTYPMWLRGFSQRYSIAIYMYLQDLTCVQVEVVNILEVNMYMQKVCYDLWGVRQFVYYICLHAYKWCNPSYIIM